MANKLTNLALQRMGRNAFFIGTAPGNVSTALTRYIMTMTIDDSTVAIAAGDTAANSGGAITNFLAQLFDATPTISSQTVSCVTTFASGGSFDTKTVKRICLSDNTVANTTTSSTTFMGGSDGQSILKGAFSLALTQAILYTDASV